MQMYILTPVILIPLALSPVLGFVIAGILMALSTAGNVVTVYLNHYPPTLVYFGPDDPKTTNMEWVEIP